MKNPSTHQECVWECNTFSKGLREEPFVVSAMIILDKGKSQVLELE